MKPRRQYSLRVNLTAVTAMKGHNRQDLMGEIRGSKHALLVNMVDGLHEVILSGKLVKLYSYDVGPFLLLRRVALISYGKYNQEEHRRKRN